MVTTQINKCLTVEFNLLPHFLFGRSPALNCQLTQVSFPTIRRQRHPLDAPRSALIHKPGEPYAKFYSPAAVFRRQNSLLIP